MKQKKFIPLSEAIQITAHPSTAALDRWVRRFNAKNPEALILRRFGTIEIGSLEIALDIEISERTPGFHAAASLRCLLSGKGGKK